MKWTNKGHQFDAIANENIDSMKKSMNGRKMVIYGTKAMGSHVYALLKSLDMLSEFSYFIDSNPKKQNTLYLGEQVKSFSDYLMEEERPLIIIGAGMKATKEIEAMLINKKLSHFRDYFCGAEFVEFYLPLYFAYVENKSIMFTAQIALTERCTLKCKKCCHGSQVSKEKIDITFEQVKNTVDIFFSKVDFLMRLDLVGGEPFLYQELDLIIEYIMTHYKDRIDTFRILTNGTVIPQKHELELIAKYNMQVRISDYPKEIELVGINRPKCLAVLDTYNINYEVEKVDWVDFGFDVDGGDGLSEEEVIEFFDCCTQSCREIRNGYLHYCITSHLSSQAHGFYHSEDEALELSSLGEDGAKVLFEFNQGYSEKGYIDACRRCNGGPNMNTHYILVAEQLL